MHLRRIADIADEDEIRIVYGSCLKNYMGGISDWEELWTDRVCQSIKIVLNTCATWIGPVQLTKSTYKVSSGGSLLRCPKAVRSEW